MLEIVTAKVLDVLQSWGLGKIKEWVTLDDRGVRFCLQLKLIRAKPQPNFDSIYAYTLAEYGDGKSKSILKFFRTKLIKEIFQNGFERGDFSNLLVEAENSQQWDEFSSQPYPISFDYQKEINEFIKIFNRLSDQTRSPVEVKQDQRWKKIDQNQDVVINTTNQILKTIQNQKILTLDSEWFKEKFEKQILGIKDKYNTELHTQTNVDRNIHALLGDEIQIIFIDKLLMETINTWEHFLRLRLSSLKKRMRTKYKPAHNFIDSVNGPTKNSLWKLDLLSLSKKRSQPSSNHNFDTLFNAMIGDFQKALAELKLGNFDSIQIPQSNNVLNELDFFISGCDNLIQNFQHNRHQKDSVELDGMGFEFGSLGDTKKIRAVAKKIIREIQSFIVQLGYLKQTNMRILGEAGIGKTHSAAHVCSERIAHGLPAILLLGRQFTSDAPIEVQLRQILDVPPLYSWKEFLQVLSASASKYHTRIPIVIDGLNEATFHGAFSNIWRLGLAGFIQDIANTKNVVLITTCRATYKEIIWPDEPLESFVLASGFNEMSVEEAVKRYFAWYKIKVDTTTSLSQFENPIYLQIFCASKNPTRRNEIYIRIGQDSIFTIYDEYLKQVNRIICENLHLHPKSSFILLALTKLGGYLWTNHFRSIPINTAVEIIDESPINRLNWENSRTRAMEDEGLLVYRDWGEDQEHLYFTHDVLAGYVIAHYIINQINMASGDYLNSDEVISRLFVDDQKQLHPLHEDICRCLAAILPIRIGRYLHELVNTPKSIDASVRALFEIQPEAINENAIEFIKKLFGEQENRFFLFDFLPSTLGYIGHPFCATFWSQLLTPLTLAERDISWSEYIRENEEIFEKIINHLEVACKGQDVISELIATHLCLYAEGVMWILTSTVRPLRDKATRALYWFGRRFPEQLLKLTSLSFTINDPYVSERMLAAIYGVAMARQKDFVDKSFSEKILPIFGRELFDAMFKVEAPFGTTHILARDYALRTIQIAILHHHNILTEEEKQRIFPPFLDSGIREWGQSKVDGELNEPIRMDFGNYTVGKLIRHRSNYDFNNDEYKAVLSNLYWRIYSFGYQEKIFKDVDQQIGQQNSSRHDDGNKTDRYGKKYSWIAFFELAGFRQDINPLTEVDEESRLSDVDIDPSFPGEIPSFELIKDDFLGDRKMSSEDWVPNGNKPDLSSYYIVDNLMSETGKWVMLDGYLSQEDIDTQRKLFVFPRGFIVDEDITNELVNKAAIQDLSNRRLPEIPEDYYTYAGEIPWADTYSHNGSEIFEFISNEHEEIRTEEKLNILRNGIPISKDEDIKFWNQVIVLSNKNNEDQLNIAVEKIAADMGLELDIRTEQTTIRIPQNEEVKLQIPIRKNSWESHHSVTNLGQGASTLSKELCEHLHLCSQPQTYDLFDESGQRASISFRFGEGLHTIQNLIYMRKDLLDKYLLETGKNLIWVVWGERSVTNNNINPSYQVFQQISQYPRTH